MPQLTRPVRRLGIVATAVGIALAALVGVPSASGAQPSPARTASATAAADTFQIQAGNSGKCLSPAFGSLWDGVLLVQLPCDGSTVQRWHTEQVAPDSYQIHNAATNRCVTLTGWAYGSVALMWPCFDSNPPWIITRSPAYATIRWSGVTNSCLDLANASVQDGAPAWTWACNGTPAQQWHLT